jgi:hypothetical protein
MYVTFQPALRPEDREQAGQANQQQTKIPARPKGQNPAVNPSTGTIVIVMQARASNDLKSFSWLYSYKTSTFATEGQPVNILHDF